jgi:uncharacterized protein YutD
LKGGEGTFLYLFCNFGSARHLQKTVPQKRGKKWRGKARKKRESRKKKNVAREPATENRFPSKNSQLQKTENSEKSVSFKKKK